MICCRDKEFAELTDDEVASIALIVGQAFDGFREDTGQSEA